MTPPLRKLTCLAALSFSTASCSLIFSSEAPPSARSGSSIDLVLQLVADGAEGSDAPLACADIPDGWAITAVTYSGFFDSQGQMMNGSASLDMNASDSLQSQDGRPGHSWQCYMGPFFAYDDTARGRATFAVDTSTATGEFIVRFAAGSQMLGGTPNGAPTARVIVIDGVSDHLDDWRPIGTPGTATFNSVRWLDDRFVAVGREGLYAQSPNGQQWTADSTITASLNDIARGNGRFVIVGGAGLILGSSDLMAFTDESFGQSSLNGVAFGSGTFVAVGSSGAILATTSTVWAAPPNPRQGDHLNGVAFADGQFVAVGRGGTILTSTDGFSWVDRSQPIIEDTLNTVAYGDGRWVAAGESSIIATSTTGGASWVALNSTSFRGLEGVTYGDDTFMIVGDFGHAMSGDGFVWQTRPSGTAVSLRGVAFGADTFVAAGRQAALLRLGIPQATSAVTALPFGGVIQSDASAAQSLWIDSTGTADLTLGQLMVVGGDFSISTDNCTFELVEPPSRCRFDVVFTPSALGARTGTITIATNDPNTPLLQYSLTGEGLVPPGEIGLSPAGIDFGMVEVGMTAPARTFMVTNGGRGDLILGALQSVTAQFPLASDGCSSQVLAPQGACLFTVQFAPTGGGQVAGTIDIPSDDPVNPVVTATVSGTGVFIAVPDIVVLDPVAPQDNLRADFGSVDPGDRREISLRIGNAGSAALVLGMIGVVDTVAPPFTIATPNCSGMTLAPGADCRMSVIYEPTAAGAHADEFDIPSNDPDEASVTFSVTGTGKSPPPPQPRIEIVDTIDPPRDMRLRFGAVTLGTTAKGTVTVSNTGDSDLVFATTLASNDPQFVITTDNCSTATVASSLNCTIEVSYTPVVEGEVTTGLTLRSNDPESPRTRVVLSGTGIVVPPPEITNQPPSAPELQTPENGAEGLGTSVTLEWSDSIDPDGDAITYEVLLCKDAEFPNCDRMTVSALGNSSARYATPLASSLLLFMLMSLGVAGRKRLAFIALSAVAAMSLAGCPDPRFNDHKVEGLEANTTYFWQVIALDGKGGEAGSESWRFTTKK